MPNAAELGASIKQNSLVPLFAHLIERVGSTKAASDYEDIDIEIVAVGAGRREPCGVLAQVLLKPILGWGWGERDCHIVEEKCVCVGVWY